MTFHLEQARNQLKYFAVLQTLIHSRISHYFEDIFHEHVFAYRKNHGADTTLLSFTEQWRNELDQHKIIGIVSVDLSKVFDTLPHDLITAKHKSYGADDKTELIHDYLRPRPHEDDCERSP